MTGTTVLVWDNNFLTSACEVKCERNVCGCACVRVRVCEVEKDEFV